MRTIGRRSLLAGTGAMALLAACGASGGAALTEDDVVLGDANAPVTLIEYASTTCPHCAAFHAAVWEQLKTNYIDTGRVRFVFREFPTQPIPVAVAGFQVARCGGASPEQYFVRVGELFRQQDALARAGGAEGIRRVLMNIGNAAGLSDAQVTACINDNDAASARMERIYQSSRPHNITGTPGLVINGRNYNGALTYEALSAALDAAGAASG